MKKSYPFTEMSTEKFCIICKKPLKRRIAEEKPTANRCYKHFKIEQGNRQRREVAV